MPYAPYCNLTICANQFSHLITVVNGTDVNLLINPTSVEPDDEPLGAAAIVEDKKNDQKYSKQDESASESDWDDSSTTSSEDDEAKELYKDNPAARFLKKTDDKSAEKVS